METQDVEVATVKAQVEQFETFLNNAFDEKYRFLYKDVPTETREFLRRMHFVRRMDILGFVDAYVQGGVYPICRLSRIIHLLFDLKLQRYFIEETDLGLYNRILDEAGITQLTEGSLTGHTLLRHLSRDQDLIGKSRILWERLMNAVYYLETGEVLENRVSGNKSKLKVFFNFIETTPRWSYLKPYRREIMEFDRRFRTPEFHKGSILRGELFGRKNCSPTELLSLINRMSNGIWDLLLARVSGTEPHTFTDLHLMADGTVDPEFTRGGRPNCIVSGPLPANKEP